MLLIVVGTCKYYYCYSDNALLLDDHIYCILWWWMLFFSLDVFLFCFFGFPSPHQRHMLNKTPRITTSCWDGAPVKRGDSRWQRFVDYGGEKGQKRSSLWSKRRAAGCLGGCKNNVWFVGVVGVVVIVVNVVVTPCCWVIDDKWWLLLYNDDMMTIIHVLSCCYWLINLICCPDNIISYHRNKSDLSGWTYPCAGW